MNLLSTFTFRTCFLIRVAAGEGQVHSSTIVRSPEGTVLTSGEVADKRSMCGKHDLCPDLGMSS
jgi:hypothetical protein